MKATFRDVCNALTVRNAVILGIIVGVSVALIDVLGYVIWRRFPIPALIIFVAALGWKIGRRIGHVGLTRILNRASVGLGVFGLVLWAAAVIDGVFFTEHGYLTWTVMMSLWGWLSYHVWAVWQKIKNMPDDRLIHVTEGTEAIYAQMTYREARGREALKAYEDATKQMRVAHT
jgi:hypothetical protein